MDRLPLDRCITSVLGIVLFLLAPIGELSASPPQRATTPRLAAKWLGQDGHDYVGPSSKPDPSDVQDIHLVVVGVPENRTIQSARVTAQGGAEWRYNGPYGPWCAEVRRARNSTRVDVFIEPSQVETGRPFSLALTLDDGRTLEVPVAGGTADSNLRMPGAALKATWVGQQEDDHTGLGPNVGPDGVVDVHVSLSGLSHEVAIRSAAIEGTGLTGWRYGTNPEALNNALLVRDESDPSRAALFFQPEGQLRGRALSVSIAYDNGKVDRSRLTAGPTDSTRRIAATRLPEIIPNEISVKWLGQDGTHAVDPGDVHLTLDGTPTDRPVAAVVLSGGGRGTWFQRLSDRAAVAPEPDAEPLVFRQRAADRSSADLAFPPRRDEEGDTMTLRLVLEDGSMAVVRFPGGPCDPSRRAGTEPGPGAITVRPGDDLNSKFGQAGKVHLSRGTYPLRSPLVLTRPVRITADAGTVLVFEQPEGAPPWREAISLGAGHVTLDGFAVRFAGPIRWADGIVYGPAVIGTQSSSPAQSALADLNLVNLDLESPPPDDATRWVEATRLVRLLGARGGRIEGCTLRGGTVEFNGGPWRIVGNQFHGTPPGTFSPAVFAGHDTHDLILQDNHARSEPSAGKTWRFLVLTGSGYRDLVDGNQVEGIGPRDDDTIPNMNSPEIILTESYRLHFEGRPMAVSNDGRLVRIPSPQGTPVRSGDALAILSGTGAGGWSRIVQVIDPTTYLVEPPLPAGVQDISIASGFVRETFSRNTIDARGGSRAANLVLVGNHYGTRVVENRLIGAGTAFKITASPTEQPIHWGWSHAPMMGLSIERNAIVDPLQGGFLAVERGKAIKSSRGRTYLSGAFRDNVLIGNDQFGATWKNHKDVLKPRPIEIGDEHAAVPGEHRLEIAGNDVGGEARFRPDVPLRVHDGTTTTPGQPQR